MKSFSRIVLATCLLSVVPLSMAAGLSDFVEEGMDMWHVPGMAVGVVNDQEVVFLKGFGTTGNKGGEKVNIHTQFAIASTTKAMIAASILILADEEKLALDDLAIKHLPELQFGATGLNSEITLRDMLAHRTGYASTDFWTFFQGYSLEDQIPLLQETDPSASLRSRFQYQNTMFELLGLIIERRSGLSWNEFVKQRLWQPIGMNETYASRGRIDDDKDQVLPYLYIDGKLSQAAWDFKPELADAAGSVWSSVHDMSRWVQFLLRGGQTESGEQLISEAGFADMFTPQMLIDKDNFYPASTLTDAHWRSYGLAWFQQDFQGRKIDFHTGSLSGLVAMVGLDRDNKAGMVVLGNRDHAEMRHALLWEVFDLQTGRNKRDWNKDVYQLYADLQEQQDASWQKAVDERLNDTKTSLPLDRYLGPYHHGSLGELKITQSDQGLFLKSNLVDMKLSHWHLDTFLVERPVSDWRFLLPFKLNVKGQIQSFEIMGEDFAKVPDPTP